MIKNSRKIAILLATYNGEKYLQEQLDSLFNQTFKDFCVYIHDDKSSDTTCKIIKKNIDKYPQNIFLLKDNKKRGARDSFFWLLNKVDSEYYMFCDQDDIWLPFKIEESYDKIKDIENKYSNNCPILVHSDLIIVDYNLNVLHKSLWKYQKIYVDISEKYDYILQGNIVTGCTMIINEACKRKAFPYFNDIMMHDYWLAIISAKYGVLSHIRNATVLYRQHGNNVCGGLMKEHLSFEKRISRAIKVYKNNIPLIKHLSYGIIKYTLFRILFFVKRKIVLINNM